MGLLSSEQILREKKTEDSSSIVSLSLTHKALSDVSCLSHFKNLEKLDLKMNNLTSLEGLRECLNLKWLSTVENKLQSLKGIEGLTRLTVLNAGKNKIRSIDEVQNLINLRALIMNDNEIEVVCRLDGLKELNTVVFSRNPIRKLSLGEMKSITKISLSNCHLEEIDSSIKVCAELKELRLAHNDIKTIPEELAHNTRLQLLDLGNNVISRWSDLKVLSSLHSVRNLNLQGNPIAEKDKLVKKVKKWIPGLQIFNAKPIEKQPIKNNKSESRLEVDFDVATVDHNEDLAIKKVARESSLEGKSWEQKEGSASEYKKNSKRAPKEVKPSNGSDLIIGDKDEEKKEHVKKKKSAQKLVKNSGTINTDEDGSKSDEKKGKKEKKKKNSKVDEDSVLAEVNGVGSNGKNLKRKAEKIIDDEGDGENPVPEHRTSTDKMYHVKRREEKAGSRAAQNHDSLSAIIIEPSKKKKTKKLQAGSSKLEVLGLGTDVGLGGPSAWGD